MKSKTLSLIAGAIVAAALSASPASAGEQFDNDLTVDFEAKVQVVGNYDRARAYVRRAMRRRYTVRTPRAVAGVRG